MTPFEKVYQVVKTIPPGKVMTYKQVAEKAGVANARVVGFALHVNKNTKEVPCHRVVRSDGTLAKGYAFGGKDIQKRLLEQEGITFENDKINLQLYQFQNL